MNNKKNHELRTKVDKELMIKIHKRAKNCNMNISDYIRYVLENTRIKMTIEE